VTTAEIYGVAGGIIAAIGALAGWARWMFTPHLRETIAQTVETKVGPQLKEIPTLTRAVDRLTSAIDNQTKDTGRLTESLDSLGGKVDKLITDVEVHGARIDAIERNATPRRSRRKAG